MLQVGVELLEYGLLFHVASQCLLPSLVFSDVLLHTNGVKEAPLWIAHAVRGHGGPKMLPVTASKALF